MIAIFLPILLLLFGASTAGDPAADVATQLKRFTELYATVEREAAEPVNSYSAFYSGAIPGMLRRLDPHSVFFDPAQFARLKELEKSTAKGFGTVVSVLPGRVIVLQTFPGTPSERAGIQPGDEILSINDVRLDRLSFEQLVEFLGASRQRDAKLIIRRPGGSRLIELSMSPAQVRSPSVDLSTFAGAGVGYVRVKDFEVKTAAQIREAIEKLGGKNLRALLLDLRNNPGGLMGAALETASLFLEPETLIVSVQGRKVETRELKVPKGTEPYRFPIAVLINGKSASGSEIVAGALQDHKRAIIVGVPSFGKGLVQSVFPLSEGTGLALTTAFYYTPSGRSIQRPLKGGQLHTANQSGGITPDVLVYPEAMSRLRIVLEATGAFTSFASETVRKLDPVTEDFEVSPSLLDDFHGYLAERRIQPGVSEWSADRQWIRSRLKQEILNLTLGVEKGDLVELERDIQVHRALDALKLNRDATPSASAD